MEYKISEIANITGVSTRTLRYYHEIKLLEQHLVRLNNEKERMDKIINKTIESKKKGIKMSNKEKFAGLEMVAENERFTKYYEDIETGLMSFFYEAIKVYTM